MIRLCYVSFLGINIDILYVFPFQEKRLLICSKGISMKTLCTYVLRLRTHSLVSPLNYHDHLTRLHHFEHVISDIHRPLG